MAIGSEPEAGANFFKPSAVWAETAEYLRKWRDRVGDTGLGGYATLHGVIHGASTTEARDQGETPPTGL